MRFRSCCSISCRHVQWETLTPLPTAVQRASRCVGQWESSQALLLSRSGHLAGDRSPSLASYRRCNMSRISARRSGPCTRVSLRQPLVGGLSRCGRSSRWLIQHHRSPESPSCPSPSSPRALGQRRPTALPNDHDFCRRRSINWQHMSGWSTCRRSSPPSIDSSLRNLRVPFSIVVGRPASPGPSQLSCARYSSLRASDQHILSRSEHRGQSMQSEEGADHGRPEIPLCPMPSPPHIPCRALVQLYWTG